MYEIGGWGELGDQCHSVVTDPKGQLWQCQWDGDRQPVECTGLGIEFHVKSEGEI